MQETALSGILAGPATSYSAKVMALSSTFWSRCKNGVTIPRYKSCPDHLLVCKTLEKARQFSGVWNDMFGRFMIGFPHVPTGAPSVSIMTVEHLFTPVGLCLKVIRKRGNRAPPLTSEVVVTPRVGNPFLEIPCHSFAIMRFVCREFHDESIDMFRISVCAFLAKFDLSSGRNQKPKIL